MSLDKPALTIYLAPWQVRMVQDFTRVRKKIDRMVFLPGTIHCPQSYKIPIKGLSIRDWILYLTDEQMVIVKERLGLKTNVSSINITEELLANKTVQFM